jgi:hypothetical protein
MELTTTGARTRTRKLRQSQDDRASIAVLAWAAPVAKELGICKPCPAFVASRFKLSIENHGLTRGSRVGVPKRSFGSIPAADFRVLSSIVPWYPRLRRTRVEPDFFGKIWRYADKLEVDPIVCF